MTDHKMCLIGLAGAARSFGYLEQHRNPAQCFAGRLNREMARIKNIFNIIQMDEVPFSIAGIRIASVCRKIVR